MKVQVGQEITIDLWFIKSEQNGTVIHVDEKYDEYAEKSTEDHMVYFVNKDGHVDYVRAYAIVGVKTVRR